MSLLRSALALGLLLGASAEEPQKPQPAKGHLRHHKRHGHHKHRSAPLWSHGQKFELVLPNVASEVTVSVTPDSQDSGLVKLARKETSENPTFSEQADKARSEHTNEIQHQAKEEVQKIQNRKVTARREAAKVAKVSAALKDTTDKKSQQKDDKSYGTRQRSVNSNTQAAGFANIRQELRLAKNKEHQIKVLNKHLDSELDIIFKSSELQKTATNDEESAKLLQHQTSQLKTMAEQTEAQISESKKVASQQARLAAKQAEALRDEALAAEKAAQEQLQKSQKAEMEADKLDRIALKELRKVEANPKGAWIQENATAPN